MRKVFVIHENDAWVEPLRAQFAKLGTPTEEFEHEHIHDMHLTDYLAWAPMILFIVVINEIMVRVVRTLRKKEAG